MEQKTMGELIAALRKKQGMTQQALADKMGVTDKAVSKWERNLSCPDIKSLPKLAEILGVSVEELMLVQPTEAPAEKQTPAFTALLPVIFNGVALAMGVAVVTLQALGQLNADSAVGMLGLGLACLAMNSLSKKE